ncbi:MAG: hypothetical protein FJ145_21515 [Deltaproteobacteria bacterium]|nr:hypothetical protein [Deltaproteobacteria bacterium]
MAEIKIIARGMERRPCVCGAAIARSPMHTEGKSELWLCTRHCGARGLTYQGALRRKVRLDLLSWGDLRRNARALIDSAEDAHRLCAAPASEAALPSCRSALM